MKYFINRIALSVFSLIISIVIITAPLFGWFVKTNFLNVDITGSSVLSHFAGGDGSENNPFLLTHKRHVYNLAWLQNFNQLNDKKYYFKLQNDINMDGLAVPPIGTEALPFIGNFNGNLRTISNLFVSNKKSELKTIFNINDVDLGKEIGFFGRVDSPSDPYQLSTAGEAYNFYLENINISSSVNSSVIGIVCGYNNGSLYNIGVSNSSFKLANNIAIRSDFSLIGEVGENTAWLDLPGYFGNKLLIDPNYDPNNRFQTLAAGSAPIPVPGSVAEHAYYTPRLDSVSESPTPDILYKSSDDNPTITYDNGIEIRRTFKTITKTQITSGNYVTNNIPVELWNAFTSISSNTRYIRPVNNPSPLSLVEVDFLGGKINIPNNGIWFKPKGSGTCSIAFAVGNQSSDAGMALYRYKRDINGNITNWHETVFVLEKSQYGNKDIVYFETEVDKDYEYVIGKSSQYVNLGRFLYLILGGVGFEGGGSENNSSTERIDYVMRVNNQFPDLSLETYNLTPTYLSFSGTTSSEGGYMYYNKTTFNSNTAVYYYSGISINIIENVTANPQSALANPLYLDTIFPDWMYPYLNSQ